MTDSVAASIETKLADLGARVDALTAERDEYRKLYLQTLEICRKLELGIAGPKARAALGQRGTADDGDATAVGGRGSGGTTTEPSPSAPPATETKVAAHTRQKPTGRRPLPEKLPRVDVEVLLPEVQQQGLAAFVRIGEDVTETVERRPASLVVVRTHKPKFVAKDCERSAETQVLQAAPPELPIEEGRGPTGHQGSARDW